jgi:hypothetical protein
MNALSIDRPSDASRYDYRRLYVDPPCDDTTAALLCWLHAHGPRLAEAQRALSAIRADVKQAVDLEDALSAAEAAVAALRVECEG